MKPPTNRRSNHAVFTPKQTDWRGRVRWRALRIHAGAGVQARRRIRIHAKQQFDPTHTLTIRRKYMADLGRRFRAIRGYVRRAIVDNDALGVKKGGGRATLTAVTNQAKDAEKFEFVRSSDAATIDAFMSWLDGQIVAGELELMPKPMGGRDITAIGRNQPAAWANLYIMSAYQSAINQAENNLKRIGVDTAGRTILATLNKPIHADKLALLFTRNFEELNGITVAMANAIRRELSIGMAQGVGAREIAKRLNKQISISYKRALRIARTEIIETHAEATLNTYEEFRIDGVSAQAEFTTAGDNRVCKECEKLEGKFYTIRKARGVIPVHPNCRCAWLPVIKRQRRKRRR